MCVGEGGGAIFINGGAYFPILLFLTQSFHYDILYAKALHMTLAPHTHHSRITVCVCVCVGGYSYHWKALLSISFLSAYLSNIMSCTLGACTYTPPGILGYQCVCVCV